jgi:hypothetical protein
MELFKDKVHKKYFGDIVDDVGVYQPITPCSVGKTEHWKKHREKKRVVGKAEQREFGWFTLFTTYSRLS